MYIYGDYFSADRPLLVCCILNFRGSAETYTVALLVNIPIHFPLSVLFLSLSIRPISFFFTFFVGMHGASQTLFSSIVIPLYFFPIENIFLPFFVVVVVKGVYLHTFH